MTGMPSNPTERQPVYVRGLCRVQSQPSPSFRSHLDGVGQEICTLFKPSLAPLFVNQAQMTTALLEDVSLEINATRYASALVFWYWWVTKRLMTH